MRTKRTLVGLALVALAGCTGAPSVIERSALEEVGVPAEDGILLRDDFDTGELDEDLWQHQETGRGFETTNDENQAYVTGGVARVEETDPETGADGVLVIEPRHTPGYRAADGREYDFQSARLVTADRFEYRYGTASARIRIEGADEGIWPAFWQLGADLEEVSWPAAGEIDIMENVGEPEWVSSAVHGPGHSGGDALSVRTPLESSVQEWHTYSVTWTPERITFSVDGTITQTVTRDDVLAEGTWVYSKPQYLLLNVAVGGEYPSAVNGVWWPYRGVPERTVEAIRDGKVRMLVDWVEIRR